MYRPVQASPNSRSHQAEHRRPKVATSRRRIPAPMSSSDALQPRPACRPDPRFVGGTGRCGSHAIASLIAEHSPYALVSREVKFHVDPGGLSDLLAGRVEIHEFLTNMRSRWWKWTRDWTPPV